MSIVGKRQGNQDSFNPVFSGDGRTLAFVSGATNWKAGIAAGSLQVWRVALPSGTPQLVSTSIAGVPGNGMSLEPSLSQPGIAPRSRPRLQPLSRRSQRGVGHRDEDLRRRQRAPALQQRRRPAGNAASQRPRFTFDGADVVFGSSASNLLSGDGNGQLDVFVRNLATGTLAALSKTAKGAFGFGYSFDAVPASKARVIAFTTTVAGIVPGDVTTLPHPVAMTLSPNIPPSRRRPRTRAVVQMAPPAMLSPAHERCLEQVMANPVLVEVTRGDMVESRHRGSLAVVDAAGRTVLAVGDVDAWSIRARR